MKTTICQFYNVTFSISLGLFLLFSGLGCDGAGSFYSGEAKKTVTKTTVIEESPVPSAEPEANQGQGDAQAEEKSEVDTVKDPQIDQLTESKLGLNFEDGSDSDHNDAVLCLRGKFRVDLAAGKIVSLIDQEIPVELTRNADQAQNVKIVSLDTGAQESVLAEVSLVNGETMTITIKLAADASLSVIFSPAEAGEFVAPNNRIIMAPDECRQDGS